MELRAWNFAGSTRSGEQASKTSAFEGDEHGGAPLVRSSSLYSGYIDIEAVDF